MARIRLAFDQHHALLVEEPVGTGIVDERRDVERIACLSREAFHEHLRVIHEMHAVAGMSAHRSQDDWKNKLGGRIAQGVAAHAACPWRQNARLGGEALTDTIAGQRHDRVRIVIQDRALPVAQQYFQALQNRQRGRGFPDRHEGNVVGGQVGEIGGVRIHISQPQLAMRAVQQEVERRVRHQIAGGDESQHP